VAAASAVGDPDGPLALRLSALPVPFRLVEASATARPRGGCLAVVVETRRPAAAAAVEDSAASAAAIAKQEMDREIASAQTDRSKNPPVAPFGNGGWRAIHGAVDPREAASLGAFWTLVGRAAPRGDAKQTTAVALAFAPAKGEPRGEDADLAASRRFGLAYQRADKALRVPAIEHREKLERGQRDLWLLIASPCGAAAENEADTGSAALALTAALARSRPDEGVSLEPLITSDAVGVVAHAAPSRGESGEALAARVARAAARAIAPVPVPAAAFADARAALIARVGDPGSPDGRAFAAAAGLIAPSHPSWIAPLGSVDALAQSNNENASLRWSGIAHGPMRLATIANVDVAQAEVAAREVDRWIARQVDGARACPAADAARAARSGMLQVSLPSGAPQAQAVVALPAPAAASPDRGAAELLLAGLSGPDGWIAKAMAPLGNGASAQPRLAGGARAAALIIDVRAPETAIESVTAQIRGVLQRIRAGALTQADLDRTLAVRQGWEIQSATDPRRRLLELWQPTRTPESPPPTLDAWRAWAAAALADEHLVVVIAKPKR
jgi:hypothetical protein